MIDETSRRFGKVALCPLLAAMFAASADAPPAAANPSLPMSATLAYSLKAPKGGTLRDAVPQLLLAIDGGVPHLADMDTGSTGIVISATSLPDFPTNPQIRSALEEMGYDFGTGTFPSDPDTSDLSEVKYTSSGRTEYGVTLHRTATISSASGSGQPASITTFPISILAVLYTHCVPEARTCTQDNRIPSGVGVIGIGFGRQQNQSHHSPSRNPFLNVASLARSKQATRGYVVGSHSVEVGVPLTEVTTTGFQLVRLSPDFDYSSDDMLEWQPFTATITLGNGPAVSGNMLIDTGITSMFMTAPEWVSKPVRVPVSGSSDATLRDGTQVGISVNQTSPPLAYSFTMGRLPTAMVPTRVTMVGNDGIEPDDRATFVNTGFHFLDKVDYLYAYDLGYVGFRTHR